MGSACQATTFSIAKDGKYHDAVFSVEGNEIAVIYWGPDGVTRLKAHAEASATPEQIARELLQQMI